MDDSYRHDTKQKKSETKEYIVEGPTYMKL